MLGLRLQAQQDAIRGEIDNLIDPLIARATYSENIPETYRLLNELLLC